MRQSPAAGIQELLQQRPGAALAYAWLTLVYKESTRYVEWSKAAGVAHDSTKQVRQTLHTACADLQKLDARHVLTTLSTHPVALIACLDQLFTESAYSPDPGEGTLAFPEHIYSGCVTEQLLDAACLSHLVLPWLERFPSATGAGRLACTRAEAAGRSRPVQPKLARRTRYA